MTDLVVRSHNVVLSGSSGPASIHVSDGRIERVAAYEDVPDGVPLDDHEHATLMAGIVDAHVHVNEPGRTEWEGFETATRAAAAGGVTTIVDMPLNSIPPTTSVAALQAKVAAMAGKCHVDVGLWGGAVPGNAPELRDMLREGVLGFKCFLVDSGVPEFGNLDRDGARAAMTALQGTGAPLLVHAELAGPIDQARNELRGPVTSYSRYLQSRPGAAEEEAIDLVCQLALETGARAHIVHLSAAAAIPILQRARSAGASISAETTPHYLFFTAETIPDAAPQYKCAPPIRGEENRERLWAGLRAGDISAVVSDHSPCTPHLKKLETGDVESAWGGISSLQLSLAVVWTEARRRGLDLADLTRLMSEAPAELAGIADRKGRLAPGSDADIIAFEPERTFEVRAQSIEHRHKLTPYEGARLHGVVTTTYLRGRKVWENGRHRELPAGNWIAGRN